MQRITVKEIKGPLGQGEKKFYAVVDEAGAEFTTFDTKIKDITPGSVLDIEPVIKGKFVNIKEYTVMSEGTAKPPASPNGYKRDTASITHEYILKHRLEEIKSASIEGQTAYIKIMDAFCAGKLDKESDEVNWALEWGKVKIGASIQSPEAKPKADNGRDDIKSGSDVKTGACEEIDPKAPFPSVGKLLDWCREQGISRPDVLKIVGCDEQGISKVNIPDAFELVKQEIDKRRPK